MLYLDHMWISPESRSRRTVSLSVKYSRLHSVSQSATRLGSMYYSWFGVLDLVLETTWLLINERGAANTGRCNSGPLTDPRGGVKGSSRSPA